MEILRAILLYARGAEHRPNTEFMWGDLFPLLTFHHPNGTRTTNLETVRCISADFGRLKNMRACPEILIPD